LSENGNLPPVIARTAKAERTNLIDNMENIDWRVNQTRCVGIPRKFGILGQTEWRVIGFTQRFIRMELANS